MKFKTIIADPPWDHQCWAESGKLKHAGQHYKADAETGCSVMSFREICRLPVASVADTDANLLLWTTAPHLEQAIRVMRHWGFSYVSFVPWIKMQRAAAPKRGTGYHAMSCCEPLLIGKRGKGCPVTRGELGVIFHPPGPHSAKPDDQYEWAEHYQGPFLEMFARPDGPMEEPRPGWTRVGNEITGQSMQDDLSALALLSQPPPFAPKVRLDPRLRGREKDRHSSDFLHTAHLGGFQF